MFHHRRTSKELDVLEASRYFSDYNEANSAANGFGTKHTQKVKKKRDKGWIKGRISLDMQVKNILNLDPQHCYSVENQVTSEKKKCKKQPSSPGGRLATFLNSLFSHSSSKKKNSKHFEQSVEEDSRTSKRRISISHFRSSNAAAATSDAKLLYDSSSPNNSGFRSPPPHVQTPTKSYKELLSFSKLNRHVKSGVGLQKPTMGGRGMRKDDNYNNNNQGCCLEEKWKLRDGVVEKLQKNYENNLNHCSSEKMVAAAGEEMMKLRKFDDDDDDDDGGDQSDSSSDLFELQIYDLDYYSNGLPVYESTDIDSIKRRNSVSSGVC